jgi:hypothetical protein
MKALSSTELKIDDLDDELQFTLSREIGWIEIVLEAGAISGFAIYAILQQRILLGLCCAIGIGALLINWALGPTTVFRISARGVVATGNLRRWSAADVEIAASEIKSIGWSFGGENSPGGIYVWHGWKSTCVLPGISRNRAQAAIDAIKAKFPQFTIENGPAVSLSLGVEI